MSPTTPLTDRELLLTAYLLEQGADAIFKRICEDAHPDAQDLLTPNEQDALMFGYEQYNSNGRDFEPGDWFPQGSVQSLAMAHRIRILLCASVGLPVPAGSYDADDLKRQIKAKLLSGLS